MSWMWAAAAVWLVVAVLLGVLIGRGIRLADHKARVGAAWGADEPNFVVDPALASADSDASEQPAAEPSAAPAPARDRVQRPIPNARSADRDVPASSRTPSARDSRRN